MDGMRSFITCSTNSGRSTSTEDRQIDRPRGTGPGSRANPARAGHEQGVSRLKPLLRNGQQTLVSQPDR